MGLATIAILGAWGSGTTALAAACSALGTDFLPPYFETNDPRTRNSFESLRFRALVHRFLNERDPNVFSRSPPPQFQAVLRKFRAELESQGGSRLIGLKMPLACLCIAPLAAVFQPYFVVVHRPLDEIEASRRRRGWPAVYGAQGAQRLYSRIFSDLATARRSYLAVAYEELVAAPARIIEQVAGCCSLTATPAELAAAAAMVKRPTERRGKN